MTSRLEIGGFDTPREERFDKLGATHAGLLNHQSWKRQT
jgi:hypothetical protein